MRSTFKVLFYVKKGSAKPNGNLPLMCRLTVDGEIKQFSCKLDVSPARERRLFHTRKAHTRTLPGRIPAAGIFIPIKTNIQWIKFLKQ